MIQNYAFRYAGHREISISINMHAINLEKKKILNI